MSFPGFGIRVILASYNDLRRIPHFCFLDYVCWLVYVQPALPPREEANLIMVDKLFAVLLDLVCQYFIEDFCIDVHQGYWPKILFVLVVSLPGFGIRMTLAS